MAGAAKLKQDGVLHRSLPSPACHWIHCSFQRLIEGDYESHRPGHHQNQRHEDDPKRDQKNSKQETLRRRGES